jgi:hypothetical protein
MRSATRVRSGGGHCELTLPSRENSGSVLGCLDVAYVRVCLRARNAVERDRTGRKTDAGKVDVLVGSERARAMMEAMARPGAEDEEESEKGAMVVRMRRGEPGCDLGNMSGAGFAYYGPDP